MKHFQATPIQNIESQHTTKNYLNNSRSFETLIGLLSGIIPFTLAGRKLSFYNMFLDFLRAICLKVISNNQNHWQELMVTGSDFAQLLLQLDMATVIDNKAVLHPKYAAKQQYRPLRKQQRHYQFIIQLISYYNHNDARIPISNGWKRMILDKKLDYEIRLCETLINLEKFEVGKKIKSPFKDSYYTGSGENAFNSYTKLIFLNYANLINETTGLKNILDIGCGYGNSIDTLIGNHPSVSTTGIELNQEVASATKQKFKDIARVAIVNKSIFDYQPDKKFDLILLNYVLFYFSHDEKVILFKHLDRLLSEDGRILVCQYYSGIENMKVSLSSIHGDTNFSKKIEIYYANKISYANTLWNNTVDAFKEAERFDLFQNILNTTGFCMYRIFPADKFYYSFFIEITRQHEKGRVEKGFNASSI
ncbi:MAG: class I SAM-dependent methyltransferase [Bacteroidales bacterium]|nr:MAG: class I SAM-dependent methyltransferase [Bacteroidales bacterium]